MNDLDSAMVALYNNGATVEDVFTVEVFVANNANSSLRTECIELLELDEGYNVEYIKEHIMLNPTNCEKYLCETLESGCAIQLQVSVLTGALGVCKSVAEKIVLGRRMSDNGHYTWLGEME